ncbi:MAG: large subunit ribosomal protein [Actinomycetota bacterium]|jgi:large subunit ribosomal protein L22|nr:large subunit ribosomal protein [Actinomycetota bacterium]
MARKIAPDAQEAIATAKFIRMSSTKARQVVDLIRGRHVNDARRVLQFTSRGASAPVGKVLESAIANAEHNRGLPGDELVVARAWVDEGPTLKRFRPRAQGRATRIRKRTCHISVVVGRPDDVVEELPETPATKQTARRVRKDTAGSPAPRASATKTSEAAEAAPEKTSKTASSEPAAPKKKTTAKKTTAKKTTAKKTTKKKDG